MINGYSESTLKRSVASSRVGVACIATSDNQGRRLSTVRPIPMSAFKLRIFASMLVACFVLSAFWLFMPKRVYAQQTCGGTLQYDQLLFQANDIRWPHCDYWFWGNQGDWVEIHINIESGNLQPWIGLTDSGNRYIADSTNGKLRFKLNQGTGWYGIRVTSAVKPRTFGSFHILLQQADFVQHVTVSHTVGGGCGPSIYIKEIYEVDGALWVISEVKGGCRAGERGVAMVITRTDDRYVNVVNPSPVIHFISGINGQRDDAEKHYYYSYPEEAVRSHAQQFGLRIY